MRFSYAFAGPGAHGSTGAGPHNTGEHWRAMRHAGRMAKMARGHRGWHRGPGGGGDFAFGPPFGPGGPGGPRWGLRGGPRKRRGDVRMALLLLLAEEPRNGY